MKKSVIVLGFILLFAGCKGPKGENGNDGNDGMPGRDGNPNVILYSGVVTNNDMRVIVSGSTNDYFATVTIGDGTDNIELPYFLPGAGVNTFSVFSFNLVRIYNAKLAGATKYRVFLVAKNGVKAYGFHRLMGN